MLTKEFPTAARVQPSFIEPMQVAPVRQLPDGDKWSYEAKLDGYRCLVARRSTGSFSGRAAVMVYRSVSADRPGL
jgi:ATP-dependent DNA ligase